MPMRPLQKEIVKKLLVQPTIDPEVEFRKSVDLLKGYMKKNTFLKSFVLGISGGQDSTLAGYIAQTAVNELNEETNGSDYKFVAVSLPYGVQADEDSSSQAKRLQSTSRKQWMHLSKLWKKQFLKSYLIS
jgi:NAD+ synthase